MFNPRSPSVFTLPLSHRIGCAKTNVVRNVMLSVAVVLYPSLCHLLYRQLKCRAPARETNMAGYGLPEYHLPFLVKHVDQYTEAFLMLENSDHDFQVMWGFQSWVNVKNSKHLFRPMRRCIRPFNVRKQRDDTSKPTLHLCYHRGSAGSGCFTPRCPRSRRDVRRVNPALKKVQRQVSHLAQFGEWQRISQVSGPNSTLIWDNFTTHGLSSIESWLRSDSSHIDGIQPASLNTLIAETPVMSLSVNGTTAKGRWNGI
jgi:hypothetical protein